MTKLPLKLSGLGLCSGARKKSNVLVGLSARRIPSSLLATRSPECAVGSLPANHAFSRAIGQAKRPQAPAWLSFFDGALSAAAGAETSASATATPNEPARSDIVPHPLVSLVRRHHHVGRLDHRVSLLALGEAKLVDGFVGDRSRDDRPIDVDPDMSRGLTFDHLDDGSF